MADEEYLDGVVGLNPSQEKHQITLLFEPVRSWSDSHFGNEWTFAYFSTLLSLQLTATPLEAYKRLQLNIFMRRTTHVDLLRAVKTTLLPFLWLQEVRGAHGFLSTFATFLHSHFILMKLPGCLFFLVIVSYRLSYCVSYFNFSLSLPSLSYRRVFPLVLLLRAL